MTVELRPCLVYCCNVCGREFGLARGVREPRESVERCMSCVPLAGAAAERREEREFKASTLAPDSGNYFYEQSKCLDELAPAPPRDVPAKLHGPPPDTCDHGELPHLCCQCLAEALAERAQVAALAQGVPPEGPSAESEPYRVRYLWPSGRSEWDARTWASVEAAREACRPLPKDVVMVDVWRGEEKVGRLDGEEVAT